MKIWLDDVRDPAEHGYIGWEWVKTAHEAIERLSEGYVEAISLDHDLGIHSTLGMPHAEETGYGVACWIEDRTEDDWNYFPPKIYVHSDNPVGRANIWEAIKSINRMMIDRYNDWSEPR